MAIPAIAPPESTGLDEGEGVGVEEVEVEEVGVEEVEVADAVDEEVEEAVVDVDGVVSLGKYSPGLSINVAFFA